MGDNSNVIIATEARVISRAAISQEDALKRVSEIRPWDASVFEEHPPVIFPVECSSNRRDSHFTRMMRSTLTNFAGEAEEGRAVLDSHDHENLPIGYSISGRLVEEGIGDAAVLRVESEFYTIPGLAGRGGKKTDDYILGIRAGIYRDISVGFGLGDDGVIQCSICGSDLLDWWNGCDHFPGDRYEVPDDPNKKEPVFTTVVAEGFVERCHLSEYSPVYDGSTPGAGVMGAGMLKATRMIEAGELPAAQARKLERMYRHKLPNVREYWSIGKPSSQERTMQTKYTIKTGEALTDEQRELFTEIEAKAETDRTEEEVKFYELAKVRIEAEAGEQDEEENPDENPQNNAEGVSNESEPETLFELQVDGENPVNGLSRDANSESPDENEEDIRLSEEVRRLAGAGLKFKESADLRWIAIQLGDKVLELQRNARTLKQEAEWGRTYRAEVIRQALEEGVRAYGESFDKDRFAVILNRESTTIDDIKMFADSWKTAGDKRYPGGRQTKGNAIRLVGNDESKEVDEAHYLDA